MHTRTQAIQIGDRSVLPGRRIQTELPVARLLTGSMLTVPVVAVNGSRPGPRIWLCGAVHGDELNGVEIIRRVLSRVTPHNLAGLLLAVPILNGFGLISESRSLPDRRDLNRSFPGSKTGSLAARIANLFMTEIVSHCEYGIDLHTGSGGRTNLPQVRGDLEDAETLRLATAFGAPCMIHARVRDGSLREAATRNGSHVLLYEGGQTLRFDRTAIGAGVSGVLRVLAALDMISIDGLESATTSFQPGSTQWIRARRSGFAHVAVELGEWVTKGQETASIMDALGGRKTSLRAPASGMIIGLANNPLVHRGDAVVHIGLANSD